MCFPPCQTVEGESCQWGNNRGFPGLEGSSHGQRSQPQCNVQTVRCHTEIQYQKHKCIQSDNNAMDIKLKDVYLMNHNQISLRLLKAGEAKVYHCPPPCHASITHVMAKPMTQDANSHNAPCYPVSHIVQHLFGVSQIKKNRETVLKLDLPTSMISPEFCKLTFW